MTATWHLDDATWHAYAAGALDPAGEASVEAHVTGCATCRAAARAVAAVDTAAVWTAVRDRVTGPQLAVPLRWLRRLGMPEHELVLLGAADAVMLPWVTAVGAALACALVSGLSPLRGGTAFLGLAPLIPLLAVMAAFDATESLREVSAPTPYSKLRLALLRTTAAMAVAVPVTTVIGLVIPHLHLLAFAWLVPGLALTSTALALLTWLPPRVVGGVLASLWIVGVGMAGGADRLDLVTAPWSQAVLATAAAVSTGAFVLRTTNWRLTGGKR